MTTVSSCLGFDRGEMKNWSFKPRGKSHLASARLPLIHTDVCGPLKWKSMCNAINFLTFIDKYRHRNFLYQLKHNSGVDKHVRNFVEFVQSQTNETVTHIRSENGGEYAPKTLCEWLQQGGIVFEKTEPCQPQKNGVAERTNSVLLDKAGCMVESRKVPHKSWADAQETAVSLWNVSPLGTYRGRPQWICGMANRLASTI